MVAGTSAPGIRISTPIPANRVGRFDIAHRDTSFLRRRVGATGHLTYWCRQSRWGPPVFTTSVPSSFIHTIVRLTPLFLSQPAPHGR